MRLKFMPDFQNVTSEPLEHYYFVDPKGLSWRSTYSTHNNLNCIQIKVVKLKPTRNIFIVVLNICGLLKHNLSQLIRKSFGHISISRLRRMLKKGITKDLSKTYLTWNKIASSIYLIKKLKNPEIP